MTATGAGTLTIGVTGSPCSPMRAPRRSTPPVTLGSAQTWMNNSSNTLAINAAVTRPAGQTLDLGGRASSPGAHRFPTISWVLGQRSAAAQYATVSGGVIRALNYGSDGNAPAVIASGTTLGVNDATQNVSI